MYPITTLSSSVLALIFIAMSIKIIKLRYTHQIAIGHGEHSDLERSIRAHSNFSEYVPLALILMLCAEANQANRLVLSLFACVFILGRLSHAYAFLWNKQHFTFRKRGMYLTFISLLCLSLFNLLLLIKGL